MNLYMVSYLLCISCLKKIIKNTEPKGPKLFLLFALLELWFVYHFPLSVLFRFVCLFAFVFVFVICFVLFCFFLSLDVSAQSQ